MGHADLKGLTLRTNCAACHGLLAWAEREGLVQEQRLVAALKGNPSHQTNAQHQTLLAVMLWALQCLGVNKDSNEFWRGWSGDPEEDKTSRDWQLGHLCRTAPTVLRQVSTEKATVRQAAMYHCYEGLLLHPEKNRREGVDGNLEDRGEDIKLSEAVYLHNFKQPLNSLIGKIIAQHKGLEPLTIIDVGAGSGGMLLDVGKSVLLARKNVVLVAIDPSKVARQSCRSRAQENPHIAMHVAAGSIEFPAGILETLREKNIPSMHCIVLAKAALHDRTLSLMREEKNEREDRGEDAQTMQATGHNYVYRDENWKRVSRQQVMEDMITVLNAWKRAMPNVKLIILESHILPTRTIHQHIDRIPLLPAYLSHSLSAQYLLSANDHHKATKQTEFKKQQFMPIQVMPDQNALMSVTLLEE